ncbi:hypothetical protein [Microbispora siamensis]|uniref:DUF1648 domain-containing protein n=1 Tax=Microbispora siamensis TaxID=564413 RepID=A0ABQ4GHV5_9ACTN|nr:hypothetical protein [Microbispora siamensis]GIH61024.1 hypothetical protein Msi02_18410 [Microbispora siamensis]
MYDSPLHDAGRPGRPRRLALTVAPPLLTLLLLLLLFAVFRDRLPGRAYVSDWEPRYAPGWGQWLRSAALSIGVFEVVFLAAFTHYWRWPELQRWLVTCSVAMSVSMAAGNAVALTALIDSAGPTAPPAWEVPAEIALTVLGGAAGWWLTGPLPPAPGARTAPPPGVPLLPLAPAQRAVYAVSAWYPRSLLQGAVMLAFGWFGLFNLSRSWQGATLMALMGLIAVLSARTRLRVDGRGVEVSLPWLGGLRRVVPYDTVLFASVLPEASGRGLGMIGSSRGWGYVSGRGPVLALRLTDGREFLYSTRDADTAAALVNASLARARGAAGC